MNLRLILISFFLVLVFAGISYSIGIQSIAGETLKKELDFVPGKTVKFTYRLITTVNYVTDYEFYATGDLKDLVEFDPPILRSVAPGSAPIFNIILKFPKDDGGIDPGLHTIRFGVIEAKSGGNMLKGRTAITIPIVVRVLYPGKYLKASIDAPNINVGEMSKITIHLENWGDEEIKEVKSTVRILTPDRKKVLATLYTDSVSIASGGEKNLYVVFDSFGYEPGSYVAEATIYWDGKETVVEDAFKIGTLEISITGYTIEFQKDTINPFDIEVQSNWNSMLKNVYAIVDLPNGRIQSPTISLPPFQKTILRAYWDTHGIEIGEYDARVIVRYEGGSVGKDIKVRVVETLEKPWLVRLTSPTFLILVLIIVLIALLIVINFSVLRKLAGYEKHTARKRRK